MRYDGAIAVFVHFGGESTLYLCMGVLNALCVWLLWVRKPEHEERFKSNLVLEEQARKSPRRGSDLSTLSISPNATDFCLREDSPTTSDADSLWKEPVSSSRANISGTVNGEEHFRSQRAFVHRLSRN